jgi:hypothetical protein
LIFTSENVSLFSAEKMEAELKQLLEQIGSLLDLSIIKKKIDMGSFQVSMAQIVTLVPIVELCFLLPYSKAKLYNFKKVVLSYMSLSRILQIRIFTSREVPTPT